MTDIELGSLSEGGGEAAEAAKAAAEEATEEAGTGEWLLEFTERLDDKGLLEPLLFGPENAGQSNGEVPAGRPDQGEGPPEINAETVASIGKKVIDTMGDVKISQVVIYAEENPEQVNRLIEQELEEGQHGN